MPLLTDEFDEIGAGAEAVAVGPASQVLVQVPANYAGPPVMYGEHIALGPGDTMEALVVRESDAPIDFAWGGGLSPAQCAPDSPLSGCQAWDKEEGSALAPEWLAKGLEKQRTTLAECPMLSATR